MQPSQASTETRLPRAVQAQMAAIEARRQARPGAEAGSVAPDGDKPAVPAAPAATPPADPAVDPRESDPGYWKQRFQVTQGLLSKERGDMKARVDALLQQVADLTSQVQTLQANGTTTTKPKVDITRFYTPEQIKAYGEEQCAVMAETAMRAATEEAQRLIDAAVQPLKQREEQKKVDEEAARKQAFIDALIAEKPNYPELDKDPRWHLWLAEIDPNTDMQRQEVLTKHVHAGNAKAVAKMMNAWERSVATPQPPIAPSGGAPAADAGGGPPPADPTLTAPSDAEVKDFYKRAGLGKVKDDERVRFEARLKLRATARA